MLLQTVSGTVLYPLLSRVVRSSPKTLSTQLDEARRVFFAFGTFCVTGVILEAETFFTLLYDDRYSAAGEIACWLTLGVWVTIVSNTLERTLQALGDSRSLAWFSFVKVVCSVSVAYVGFNLAGLPGFIIGMAVGAVGGHFVLWRRLAEHGVSAWRTDLRVNAFTTVAIAIGLALTTVASTLQGALLREVVAWTYLAALGTWSASRLRQLRNIGVRVGECP
jgi:O-antigen/teichoic acid export membrane protein